MRRTRQAADALRLALWQRQRARPPRRPRGWKIRAPVFVGVGTHKSGTTWWYRLISRHPAVVVRGHPKELDYFVQILDDFTPADAADYARWFPRREGKLTGEWTPRSGHDLSTAPKLARAAAQTKLLMIVRDPITRHRSDIAMFAHFPNVEEGAARRASHAGNCSSFSTNGVSTSKLSSRGHTASSGWTIRSCLCCQEGGST